MTYEWDPEKAKANFKKHRLDFEEATTVFLDPLAITFPDLGHSSAEHRELTIGCTIKGRCVCVPLRTEGTDSHCQCTPCYTA